MSSLAPSLINTLLGGQSSNIVPVTEKPSVNSKIVRKHYYDGGHYHYDHDYSYSGGKKKSKSVALSALTLLSFLFFLHILQQCLQEQMGDSTTNPQMVVMQAKISRREGEEDLQKEAQNRVGETQDSTSKPSDSRLGEKHFTSNSELEDYDDSFEKSQVPVKLKYVHH